MMESKSENFFYGNGEIVFKEFVDNDDDFITYLTWLRNIKTIEMIGRQEYLLTMDIDQIREYVKKLNLSDHDSFFKVFYMGKFIGTFKLAVNNPPPFLKFSRSSFIIGTFIGIETSKPSIASPSLISIFPRF